VKSLFALSTVVIAAPLIGIGSASVAVRTMRPVVKNGAWRTSLTTGSTEAGLYERAQASAENGAVFRNFAAPLLQEFGHVLSVRQAATVLGLSLASIYKLCASGELVHVRILNAIRIPSLKLAGFLSGAALNC